MKIHIKIQDKIYVVGIGDILARPIQATVDGEVFEVWPEEKMAPISEQHLQDVSPTSIPIQPVDNEKPIEKDSPNAVLIRAPIPGVIIEVKVSTGETVEYGQELCVLEAMKMKNSIRAGKAGTIDKIMVSFGDQVSQNQTLMEYRREA
jgi:biotin carboxyl carrier protein